MRSMSGFLVPPDVKEVGSLAKALTGDRGAVPRGERLGNRGNQADDSHRFVPSEFV